MDVITLGRRAYRLVRPFVGPKIDERIVFFHIPKTGGMSLAAAIRRAYGVKAWIGYSVDQLHPPASLHGAKHLGRELEEYRRSLLSYAIHKPHVRFVTGHFPVSREIMDAFAHEWSFITILRDPVDRWFSHYFYNRYNRSDHFHIEDSLEDFMRSERGRRLGHIYLDKLAGVEFLDAPLDERRDAALENLERFDVVGTLEDVPGFLRAFERRFGTTLRMPSRNRNPAPELKREARTTAAVREAVEALCEPDRMLYDRIAASQEGS